MKEKEGRGTVSAWGRLNSHMTQFMCDIELDPESKRKKML